MSSSMLKPEKRVLSTLNDDGTRRWIKPRVAPGKLWKKRRLVAWFLILLFVALPWIPINGHPAILLDLAAREFTFFGKTFLPTDTLLLALFMIGFALTIFFTTALLGRVWCGWVCPQTVYMEWLYRPIERFFEGEPGSRPPRWGSAGLRKLLKLAVFLVLSFFIANTFLAYFTGVERLQSWILNPPTQHPAGFTIVTVVTLLMMFDFTFFREQTCIVACPYGRLQSVLLDRESMIVGYDEQRGEPRGKARRKKTTNGDVSLEVSSDPGDCVDCKLCVSVCPTGIDIRQGLQMECIACTQCIDACNAVMAKLKRPLGLIRYTNQDLLETHKKHILRPRIFVYPAILLILLTAFVGVLSTKHGTDLHVIRGKGLPYSTLASGEIAGQARVRVTNRKTTPQSYAVSFENAPQGVRLESGQTEFTLEGRELKSETFSIVSPSDAFADGELWVTILVTADSGESFRKKFRLIGPRPGFGPPGMRAPKPSAPPTNP